MARDVNRLQDIKVKAAHALMCNPESPVAQDLIWLCQQLGEAWKELETYEIRN